VLIRADFLLSLAFKAVLTAALQRAIADMVKIALPNKVKT
jgi:hypothetical protein